jgi:FAD/FMN-containing dehydrogenase
MGKVLFTMHTPVQAITSASCSKFKKTEGVQFKNIATEVAILVKKYRGSLSGEHGDGIVRENFSLYDWRKELRTLKRVKLTFDQIQF